MSFLNVDLCHTKLNSVCMVLLTNQHFKIKYEIILKDNLEFLDY